MQFYQPNTKDKILAAYKLLAAESTSREKFEHIRTLVQGLNPDLDKKLEQVHKALSDYEKIQKGEIIELTAENLPENTEEERQRKKTLLLFLQTYKDLQSEISRIKTEFDDLDNTSQNPQQKQIESMARIATKAKGAFGVITIAAVVIVAVSIFLNSNRTDKGPQVESTNVANVGKSKPTMQVIIFEGKQIPMTEVVVGEGTDCDSSHYHAKDHISSKSLDGSIVLDPGGCGYGRVKDIEVIQVVN